MSPQDQEYFKKVILEVLTKYDSQVDQKSVTDFVTDFVQQREHIQDVNNVLTSINSAFSTIDSINYYHQGLINAQKKGTSRVSWLKATIKTATNIKDVRKIGKIVQEVQASLAKSNNQYLSEFLGEDIEIFQPIPEREFLGIHEQAMTQELLDEIQNNSLMSLISTEQTIESLSNKINIINPDPLKIINNFFEGDLGDTDESLVTKLVTSSIIIANAELNIPELHDIDPVGIAVMVDFGLTFTKVSYKLGQGKITMAKAMDYLYDRSVADTAIVLGNLTKIKTKYITTAVGAAIGSAIYPVVGTVIGGTVGAIVGEIAGEKIKQGVRTGVKKIGAVAKKEVPKVVERAFEKVKQEGTKLLEGAKKVFNSVISWFS
ncbi:glycine zipper family protein [Microcystis aeruginosa EAWAG127a]|uniref:Glycine zipper family protein n=1 Tax=Microcystis aeruginosa EAWAG127a TaxID=2529855 RepID=A0A5J5LW30_MICAE|nr:glycine zipper family protein [Microcystis aeruginosa]KAB0241429.1 glycine zipper family protein [Microcystis aeruginosa EAWAG127a]